MALSKFILQLEKGKLQPEISQDEVDDIEKGVTEFVKLITDAVAKEEKLFTVKRIIKVGSFYENTKVGNPDEFDFLIELDGTFEVEKGCESNPCSANVKMVAPVCTNETELGSNAFISPDGYLLGRLTYERWRTLIEEVLQKNNARKNGLDRIQCKKGHLTIDTDLCVTWETGPNVECRLIWHGENGNFGIGVDMCICIPCTDELVGSWKNELLPLDFSVVPRPVLVAPSLSRYNTNVQGTVNYKFLTFWKMSMAPIEVDTMRNIPEPYRLCYLVLKWICREIGASFATRERLSSYMLKNAVLCCQANNKQCEPVGCLCQANNKQSEPVGCLEEVLNYLCECCAKNCLPAYFKPKVNLWPNAVFGEVAPPRAFLHVFINHLEERSSPEDLNIAGFRANLNLEFSSEEGTETISTETRSRSPKTLKNCCLLC